jgi:hypothetical protein
VVTGGQPRAGLWTDLWTQELVEFLVRKPLWGCRCDHYNLRCRRERGPVRKVTSGTWRDAGDRDPTRVLEIGDGFRDVDGRAIAGQRARTRPATARPEQSGCDEAGQSRAGGPRVIGAESAGHPLHTGAGAERSAPEGHEEHPVPRRTGTRAIGTWNPRGAVRRRTRDRAIGRVRPRRTRPPKDARPSDRPGETAGDSPRRTGTRAIGTRALRDNRSATDRPRAIEAGATWSSPVQPAGGERSPPGRARRTGEAPPAHAWRGFRRSRGCLAVSADSCQPAHRKCPAAPGTVTT